MSAEAPVLYDVNDHIATITFNRPDNRNSMTPEVLDGFVEAISKVKEDASLRCVVFTGKGRCFSAGADFNSQIQRKDGARPLRPAEQSYEMYKPFLSVLDLDIPTIAALNGHAIGGGFGLSLVCDMRVANRKSKYGANFTRLGLHPGMAISYLMPRLIGVPKAVELLLTGRIFTGDEAEQIGLMNYVVDGEEVMAKAMELATQVAEAAPVAVRWTKRSIYRSLEWNPKEAAYLEAFAQAETVNTQDAKEGISALLEKRKPEFKGE